jgi:hypothetical protein
MKPIRFLIAVVAACVLGAGVVGAAGLPGDATRTLGKNPLFPSGLRASALNQQSAAQFAKRVALVAGTTTFTFPSAYTSIPVCTVAGEAAANINTIRGVPSVTAYVVTSYSAASTVAASDTQFVDIVCVGNPF